jgi:stage V sporulation protein G
MTQPELQISSINIKVVKDEPPVMAYVSIVLNDSFAVRKIRIIEKDGQYLVFMPSMKNKENKYSDVCHPINAQCRSKITTAILNSYMGQLKSEVE